MVPDGYPSNDEKIAPVGGLEERRSGGQNRPEPSILLRPAAKAHVVTAPDKLYSIKLKNSLQASFVYINQSFVNSSFELLA